MNAASARTAHIPIVLVAALAENAVIGRDNKLPWRIKSDLQYFRAQTIGRPVIMGRKTFQSIGRPLPGRTNIVVSRDATFSAAGIVVCDDVAKALTIARADALRRASASIAIIGGTEIFRQTMPTADRLALTLVHARPQGDVFFPEIDPKHWREGERQSPAQGPEDEHPFTFITYERHAAA